MLQLVEAQSSAVNFRLLKKQYQSSESERRIGKAIAESVILQAMEDLWSHSLRKDSLEFFNSERFDLCAEAAGIRREDMLRMIGLVEKNIRASDRFYFQED